MQNDVEGILNEVCARAGLDEARSLPSGVAETVARMTGRNDHTGALVKIARALKHPRMVPALEGVAAIMKFKGGMDSHLRGVEADLRKTLKAYAKSELSPADFKAISGSL